MGGLTSGHRGTSPRPFGRRRLFAARVLGVVSKARPLRPGLVPLLLLALLLLPTPSSEQQGPILYVNNTDPTCQSLTPCYSTIQAAVDAAQPGDTIRLQAGTYVEQVSIQGKNNVAGAIEADRIVLEADPALPPGSVVLQGAVTQCTNGHAIRLQQSKFITIRGLTITGAGGQAISLMGGNNQNQAIHLERNRIFGNGSPECSGGITIARGNPDTLIVNNLIYSNGRNGITFIDADGGPHYVVNNTIHANHWNGLRVARSHVVFLVNNLITGNGTATGSTGGRFGVSREASTSPDPEGIHLLHNLLCGNRLGEVDGPALDPTDANNLTPTGSEGSGVLASPGCELPATVYAGLNGPDGLPNTADDDFTLKAGSPAIDHGLDPRTLGLNPLFNPVFEADYAAPGVRPRDGNGDGVVAFDLGALEGAAGEQVTPLTLSISEPADGATVPAGPLLVRGTFQTRDVGIEVGVTVNGVPAATQGNTFVALLPVTPEITSLTAVGTTAAGATASHTIALTVTPAPEPALTLHVSPASGVAPLTVVFSILGGPVPASLALDLEGDGTPEFTGSTLKGRTFTYATPGLYLPTVTVTDAQGQLHTARAVVQVLDATILEGFLQAKWQGMKDAFRRGDTEGALQSVAAGIRSRYRPALLALAGDLPAFADSLGDLQIVSLQDELAEAATVRLEDGQRRVYFIYFVSDEDGIWRILGM